MKRVLITGATGFVGSTLCEVLARAGYTVRAAVRSERTASSPMVAERVVVGEIGASTDWDCALDDVAVVVHAAARAHVLTDSPANAALCMETNGRGTEQLARAAARAGVRRLVYLSSVKVNGESAALCEPYTSLDTPRPADAYGISKLAGERHLLEIAGRTSLEATIVRPPLVYGPLVRANFLRLLRWVERGVPLPLGSIDNCRSLVSVWNLTNLIAQLLEHPAAPGRTWMVSDGEDISTPALIRRMAHAFRRKSRLLPVPVSLLRAAGSAIGWRAEIDRLCGSLVVDIALTRRDLGWSPPVSLDEGLARTVMWYRSPGSVHID